MERIRKTIQRKTIRFDTTDSYRTLQGTTMQYNTLQYITSENNTIRKKTINATRCDTERTTLDYVTNKLIRNFAAEWNPTKRPLRRDKMRNMQYARNKTRDAANKKQCTTYSTQFTITFAT